MMFKTPLRKFITSTIAVSALAISATAIASNYNQADASQNTAEEQAPTAAPSKDIVDTALSAGSFNTLATALQEAGLIDALRGDGPFTIFAPTDEAFSKIPADQLNAILADKARLTEILTYHVVAGNVKAEEVIKLNSAKTLQGGEVAISTANGVQVNDANVIQTDIATSNGVIHVIDTVLLPEGSSSVPAE